MHAAPTAMPPHVVAATDADASTADWGRTPVAWRVAASAVLFGGAIAGERLSRARPGAVARLMAAAALAAIPLAVRASRRAAAARRDGRGGPGAPDAGATLRLPSVTVLIPARDEAAAIPRLIADLGAQARSVAAPDAPFTVVVIDDRSTDGTGGIAREAACRHGLDGRLTVVRREPGAGDGKGAALRAVPRQCLGEAVVVLDADARVDAGFIRRVAARLAAGDEVFTARRRTYNAAASPLATAQAAELELDGLQLRARLAMGGAGELRGNGMAVRTSVLDAAGGWPATLTEDLDLSTLLAGLGWSVGWAREIVVWEAPTGTWHALARQRLRWAEGSVRRLFALLPWAVGSPRLSWPARIDLLVYAGQAVLPPIVVGAVAGGLRRRQLGVPVLLVGVYAASAMGLTAIAVAESARADAAGESTGDVPRARLALLGGVFAGQWLLAVPAALLRIAVRPGRVTFDRTEERLL